METRHVLIVDDSSTARMIVQRCIQMSGLPVETFGFAENGLDAIAYLRETQGVSVVVTDINMPKMDGQTFLRLLKSDPATGGIPVVVVSSIVEGGEDRALLSLGAAAVIKKPVSPAKILEAMGGMA